MIKKLIIYVHMIWGHGHILYMVINGEWLLVYSVIKMRSIKSHYILTIFLCFWYIQMFKQFFSPIFNYRFALWQMINRPYTDIYNHTSLAS